MQNLNNLDANREISTDPAALPAWLPLATSGPMPQLRADGSFDFGDSAGEALAAFQHDAIFPLAQLGTLLAQGADVDSFLQGQLSNDIAALTPDRSQLSSYNSAKGRVIVMLTLSRAADGIRLQTSAALTSTLMKRLQMFVMRAKVKFSDISATHPLLGISGPNAAALLMQAGLPLPATSDWAMASRDEIAVTQQPGTTPRFTIQAPAAQLGGIWTTLSINARPAGPQAWQLLEILAGQPSILPTTQEHFVAQMLNLDMLGGISFTKGCYPGQEVVARLHYLGQLKRRMFIGFSSQAPLPGTLVYLASGETQAIGEVVLAAEHPQYGAALLIVLQTQYQDAADLRLQSPAGQAVRLAPVVPT
jgi:folate-binding protein YgfZ